MKRDGQIIITRRIVSAVTGEPYSWESEEEPIRYEHDFEFRLTRGRCSVSRSLLVQISLADGSPCPWSWDPHKNLLTIGKRFRLIGLCEGFMTATFCEIGPWLPFWRAVEWVRRANLAVLRALYRLQFYEGWLSIPEHEGTIMSWRVVLHLPGVALTDQAGLIIPWREIRKARGLALGSASGVPAEFARQQLAIHSWSPGDAPLPRPPLDDAPWTTAAWCPTCEPSRDPTREVLDTRYCQDHRPDVSGTADLIHGMDFLLHGPGVNESCVTCRRIEEVAKRFADDQIAERRHQ